MRLLPTSVAILLAAAVPAAAGEVNATPLPRTSAIGQDRHAWFKSLTQPDTGVSCCDVSDCRRTDADWRNGQWWAKVDGAWTPIPHNKELNRQSIDGDAYVCAGTTRTIFCFVKPDMGS
jgi:hypothetical protein